MTAFIDGTLAPDEVATVAAHLRECSDCRIVVAETARFEREEASRPSRRSNWWMAAAAAVVAAVVTTPFIVRQHRSPLAPLVAAAPRDHRNIEARLTGFEWARLQAPARGEAPPDPADLKLAGAAGDVLSKTTDAHATGVSYLLIQRRSEAAATLERAARTSSDAHVWSDLAAARYDIASRDDRPSQLPEALAAADHALRLDPKLPEALFNRALIVEALGLRDQARTAWQKYLDADSGSGWATEAREHLGKLTSTSRRFDRKLLDHLPPAQLVREFPQEARTWGEGILLAEWADAPSDAKLARVHALANALAAFNGELLLGDAVGAIERGDAAILAAAHRTYRDGRTAYNQRDAARAEKQLREASALFARGGSPMAEVAAYFAASASFDQRRGSIARDDLLVLRARIDRRRYRALDAQIGWTLAVNANRSGDFTAAAREATAAGAAFHDLGERSNAAFADGIAAQALELMGNSEAAWARRRGAIDAACATADPQRCNAVLDDAAAALVRLDHSEAALALVDATADAPDAEPFSEGLSLVKRARVAARAAQPSATTSFLERARRASARIADGSMREMVETQIAVEEAALMAGRDPHRAVDRLNRAASFFSGREVAYLLPYVYLQRARAQHAAGDDDAAIADYDAAMAEIERQEARIGDAAASMAFRDTAAQVVEEKIELELSRNSAERAFVTADRRHALRPATLTAPPAELANNVAVIEYVSLPHALVLFLRSREGLLTRRIAIDRDEAAARIDRMNAAIFRRAPIEEVRAASADVYTILIAPLRNRLRSFDELAVVPDRQLYAVPFGALYDPEAKRYLIEQFKIRVAATAAISTSSKEALAPALVIGDPAATGVAHLAAGRAEGKQIAALYGATFLEAAAATREAFVSAAANASLIHYAGHASSDRSAPSASLLFAGDAGILSSEDIARLRLNARPLVVIAACGTFRGDSAHVAGMPSLARAFLTAGARGVVGTLWEVDDEDAAVLFLRFHENLKQHRTAPAALRDAQLEMLRSSAERLSHPATWSPVEVIGDDI